MKEVFAALNAQFSDAGIGLTSVSDDLSRILFFVNSPTVPGALYLYNAEARELKGVSVQHPGLSASELAEVYPIAYPARDG